MTTRTDRDIKTAEAQIAGLGVLCAVVSGAVTLWLPGSIAPDWLPWDPTRPFQAVATFGWVLALVMIVGPWVHRRWYFSRRQRLRRELGDPSGWLDAHDLVDTAGADAVRRHAGQLWPARDFAGVHGAGLPVTAAGFCAGALVSGDRRMRGELAYTPHARGFVIVGPQGSGKSQYVIPLILDMPGAGVVPSTKPELAEACGALRAELGPVYNFNPGALGHIINSLFWDPVAGCDDQATADRRAWALVRGGGGAGGINRPEFWALKGQEIIRCYLMAASHAGFDMGAVAHWANHPDEAGTNAPLTILEQVSAEHPGAVPAAWIGMLRTHLGAAPPTRTGYFATVTSCVGFMDNPTVAAACRPAAGQGFDVHDFLARSGTLFLIGSAGDKRLAPLLTALTEYLFDEAQRIASRYPGGRLPVPLSFLLDEVANTTPVPLDQWASDSRGWGITVGAVVQSTAQLATTWGRDKAEVIWENLPTKIILPGVSNDRELRALSYLAGERPVKRVTEGVNVSGGGGLFGGNRGMSTSTSMATEPVAPGYLIANLPQWHAFVLGLGRHPAVLEYEPGYRRLARGGTPTPVRPAWWRHPWRTVADLLELR